MQKKIGTILDVDLIEMAKEKARAQQTTLNHILEEALSEYLSRQVNSKEMVSAVELSFGIMQIPLQIVQKIAQEDIYETE